MKISKKGQYALISVVDLAMHTEYGHESIVNIAERQGLDAATLGQIFFTLKKAGVLDSVRGKNGGYFLSKNADEISAGDVVRAVEGTLVPTKCCNDEKTAKSCKSYESCFTIKLWKRLSYEINAVLDDISIGQLMRGYKRSLKNES